MQGKIRDDYGTRGLIGVKISIAKARCQRFRNLRPCVAVMVPELQKDISCYAKRRSCEPRSEAGVKGFMQIEFEGCPRRHLSRECDGQRSSSCESMSVT